MGAIVGEEVGVGAWVGAIVGIGALIGALVPSHGPRRVQAM